MKYRAAFPVILCVVLAGCFAVGLRAVAEANGAASVKPIAADSGKE